MRACHTAVFSHLPQAAAQVREDTPLVNDSGATPAGPSLLMQWGTTAVKQLKSNEWAAAINPFHSVN